METSFKIENFIRFFFSKDFIYNLDSLGLKKIRLLITLNSELRIELRKIVAENPFASKKKKNTLIGKRFRVLIPYLEHSTGIETAVQFQYSSLIRDRSINIMRALFSNGFR